MQLQWLLKSLALFSFIRSGCSAVCPQCSIHSLDLASYVDVPCNLDKVVEVNPVNGVVYLAGQGPPQKAPHYFGTHSAPYFLNEAIKSSTCYTPDIETAKLIFVYDYCYYIWWLADVHTLGRDKVETPGDYLIKGWERLTQTPRWKRNNGADFVFYDSHPGFVSGQAEHLFYSMTCNNLKNATHILVERPQRNTCETFHEIKKQIITPYVPNVLSRKGHNEFLHRPSIPLSQRNMTVYFSGTCGPRDGNVGKQMRSDVVKMIGGKGPDVDVTCTNDIYITFETMLSRMEHTIFCLVIAGDAQSTRRLTEIFMAGCIPVFIGPPYNSMPLSSQVRYDEIGVFFNVTEYKSWMPDEEMQWSLEGKDRARWAQEAKWWIPDADVSKVVIPVQKLQDVLPHLRQMPQTEVARKLKLMEGERFRFTFQETLLPQPTAVSSIMEQMCMWTRGPERNGRHTRSAVSLADHPDSKSGPFEKARRRARRRNIGI